MYEDKAVLDLVKRYLEKKNLKGLVLLVSQTLINTKEKNSQVT